MLSERCALAAAPLGLRCAVRAPGVFVRADAENATTAAMYGARDLDGVFSLGGDQDSAMQAAFTFLRSKGAFPEDDGDDSDEMIFGDDDNLDDYA